MIKSQDDLNKQGRDSEVLLEAISKLETTTKELERVKKQLEEAKEQISKWQKKSMELCKLLRESNNWVRIFYEYEKSAFIRRNIKKSIDKVDEELEK